MHHRSQNTIGKAVEVSGVSYLSGFDVSLRFLPAPPNFGLVFERVDRPGAPLIPATLEFSLERQRRTAVGRGDVVVEMTEHVLAALAGLQIDNCLIQIDGPETPGMDGSALAFAEALLRAGIVEQDAPRRCLVIEHAVNADAEDGRSGMSARPLARPTLAISYHIDYGARSPIPPQNLTVEISPDTFLHELAFSRTFILETEINALRARGYGRRTTTRDLLVFGPDGPIENELRTPDECARHKILDCVGDFALLGCDLVGHVSAYRSGHELNREIAQLLRNAHGLACRREAA